MERRSWESIFINICETVAQRSTCARIKTAAIIVKNKNIISIGYNGCPSGFIHCQDYWYSYWKKEKNEEYPLWQDFVKSDYFYKNHHLFANKNELHAEMNCICNAAKNNTNSKDATIFTLYAPCTNCAKIIISSGISCVYYKYEYKRDIEGIDLLKNNNISCFLVNN